MPGLIVQLIRTCYLKDLLHLWVWNAFPFKITSQIQTIFQPLPSTHEFESVWLLCWYGYSKVF